MTGVNSTTTELSETITGIESFLVAKKMAFGASKFIFWFVVICLFFGLLLFVYFLICGYLFIF